MAGKTSFTRFLRNKKFEEEYRSTSFSDTKQVLVKHAKQVKHTKQVLEKHKFNICGTEWTDLDKKSEYQEVIERLLSKLNKEEVEPDSESNNESNNESDNESDAEFNEANDSQLADVLTNQPANQLVSKLDNQLINNQPSNNQNLSNKQSLTVFEEHIVNKHEEEIFSKSDTTIQHNIVVDSERNMTNTEYVTVRKELLAGKHDETLEMWDMVTLLDTGGQPELINMLPAVNTSAAVSFIVFDLSKGVDCLNQLVLAQSSKPGYEKRKLNYTNLYLLKCLLSFIKMSARKKIDYPESIVKKCCSKSSVCFIGTHADKLVKDLLENEIKNEAREVENSAMKELFVEDVDHEVKRLDELLNNLIKSLKDEGLWLLKDEKLKAVKFAVKESYDNSVNAINEQIKILANKMNEDTTIDIWNLRGRNLIPVDNTTSGKPQDENHVAEIIRSRILKKVEQTQFEIPIVWFILELQLYEEEVFISLDKVKALCDKIMPKSQKIGKLYITGILKFFHSLGTLMYFDEVDGMNEYVITKPQWLFNTLTDLVNCTFNTTKILDDSISAAFKYQGILCNELLDNINLSIDDIDVDTNTNSDDKDKANKKKRKMFINLLIYLRIVAPTDQLYVGKHKDENNQCYFMPSILPTCNWIADMENILPVGEFGRQVFYKDDQEECLVEPLLIEFTYGTIPRGFLCFLAVQLLQKNTKWKLYCPNENRNWDQFDNLIKFRVDDYHYFALIDRTFCLDLQVRVKDTKPTNVYFEIQESVTAALQDICKDFNSHFNDLRYGFLCRKCPSTPDSLGHLALLSQNEPIPKYIPDSAQCKYQGTKLKDEHKIWLKVVYLIIRSCMHAYSIASSM